MVHTITQNNPRDRLNLATDPQLMAKLFENYFAREYPNRGLKVNHCKICRIFHKPGESCSVTYCLQIQDSTDRSFVQWVHGKLLQKPNRPSQQQKAQPSHWPGCGFWKPVSFWPEMNMVLRVLPYDPQMPYLFKMLDIGFVDQNLARCLTHLGIPEGWQKEKINFEIVKYRPGKSCVIRYNFAFAKNGEPLNKIVFSKTYGRKSKSRYLFEILQNICLHPDFIPGAINIPAPVLHIESTNTIWQTGLNGRNIGSIGREVGWQQFLTFELVAKIAAMLAALHKLKLPPAIFYPLPPSHLLLKNANDYAVDIMRFNLDTHHILKNVIKRLFSFAHEYGDNTPETVIHGSFKAAQILYDNGQISLVDFDAIAWGDPLYDVAEFIASIDYLTIKDGVPVEFIAQNVKIFLHEYQKAVPWTCDLRRLAWYIQIFLLGKIHSSLKRFDIIDPKSVDNSFKIIEKWLKVMEGEITSN